MTRRIAFVLPSLSVVLLCSACPTGPVDDDDSVADDDDVIENYEFESRFQAGDSSVSYSGQVFRHLLISEAKTWMSGLTAHIDDGSYVPSEGTVVTDFDFYFEFDSASGGLVALQQGDNILQDTFDEVSSGKNLVEKLAGNDAVTDHKDWSSEFEGWAGAGSPESLVRAWIDQLEAQAVARVNGEIPQGPDGEPLTSVALTPEGHDLTQLVQKFLLGAITLSQGSDDYLDDDVPGKGLLSDHTEPADEGSPYTDLEHAWDEGFGYFGAARDFVQYSDAEIADGLSIDSNGDGYQDLLTETNSGNSVNAGKRDSDASSEALTDFTAQAWGGFTGGRDVIHRAEGELSSAELEELQGYRDEVVLAWESAVAATVVHYINDTLQDMADFDTADYSFSSHAQHWSEMKGFALGLQFNPRSPLSDGDFTAFHELVADAPVLPGADPSVVPAYSSDLLAARALLQDAYGFDAANMGDEGGRDGW